MHQKHEDDFFKFCVSQKVPTLKVEKIGQVSISKQRESQKRLGTPYGFRNPYMLPSTDTYSWHFNVRCMQMDSLIFHSSNYIATSRQARSAKVS